MKSNAFRSLMDFLGLDIKKEKTKIIVLNALLILSTFCIFLFVLKQFLVLLIGLFLIMIFNFFIFNSYSKRKAILLEERNVEFIQLITILQTFLTNNNNVYQSLGKLIDYANLWMQDNIKELLQKIDEDKSVKPFVDFADNFTLKTARNVMVSIYQMIDSGSTSAYMDHFSLLFLQISKTEHDDRKKKKERSFDMVCMLPMIGAALITIILSFSIVMVLGDIVNVF